MDAHGMREPVNSLSANALLANGPDTLRRESSEPRHCPSNRDPGRLRVSSVDQ